MESISRINRITLIYGTGYTDLNRNSYANNVQSMSGGTVRSMLPIITNQKTK